MFWMRAYTLRGEVGGGWALEFPSFLGPVKWEQAYRRVPFGSHEFHQVSVTRKNLASTSLWTYYSCLNSMMKRKYNVKLQDFPRLTMLSKGYDTDIKGKANIFDLTEIKSFMLGNMESSYWLVRQAISIVAFLGGFT